MLLVVVFIAAAVAGLAALASGRVVAESRFQDTLEADKAALNDAYGQLQLAFNVVNASPYDEENHNLELRDSIAGLHGGTVAGDPPAELEWVRDPDGVLHGKIRGTDVRVYHGRDYILRVAVLRGETDPDPVDAAHLSDGYFVLEALGRHRDTVRLVSALVRENEPFSSFVLFQNNHPLGVSGSPRGLIHCNESIEFYYENGSYVDVVSAVNGFDYKAGATPENTYLRDANPEALAIGFDSVDFEMLRAQANLFEGTPGLDAEITFSKDGKVKIEQFTPPHWDWVEKTFTRDVYVGTTTETYTETRDVQVGTTTEVRTRDVLVGYRDETYTVSVPVYEDQEVTRTRDVPVYELQTVTRTRWVRVFVPYDDPSGDGGTTIGGGTDGVPGEYVWVQEEYETEAYVIVGHTTETYTTIESVRVGTTTETRVRQVPIYEVQVYEVEVPVYEPQTFTETREVPVYEKHSYTQWVEEFFKPTSVDKTEFDLDDGSGVVYIDGRVTKLEGDIKGRMTLVANEKVRVTGTLRYVDDKGQPAMLHGDDYKQPYERNRKYGGQSVLGVIARKDVVFTADMPNEAEINASLMSVDGRVGLDGFAIFANGEPTTWYYYGLTTEEIEKEKAYNYTEYRTKRFLKESLRRIGGAISNSRIMETYLRTRSDGTAYVHSGFKRGRMLYDLNLLFNPPPNFVQVPRPVVISYAPVLMVRDT